LGLNYHGLFLCWSGREGSTTSFGKGDEEATQLRVVIKYFGRGEKYDWRENMKGEYDDTKNYPSTY
jgi:hypothetical protein